jgi:hypothetical protein
MMDGAESDGVTGGGSVPRAIWLVVALWREHFCQFYGPHRKEATDFVVLRCVAAKLLVPESAEFRKIACLQDV